MTSPVAPTGPLWHHLPMAHPLPATHVATLVSWLSPAGLWLFGSQVGRSTLGSGDVDLGWLAGAPVEPLRRLALQEDAAALLGRDVDLVVLDDASPILVRQVLTKGLLLHEADPTRVARFVAESVTRYADLMRVRRPMEEALLRRIADGRP